MCISFLFLQNGLPSGKTLLIFRTDMRQATAKIAVSADADCFGGMFPQVQAAGRFAFIQRKNKWTFQHCFFGTYDNFCFVKQNTMGTKCSPDEMQALRGFVHLSADAFSKQNPADNCLSSMKYIVSQRKQRVLGAGFDKV